MRNLAKRYVTAILEWKRECRVCGYDLHVDLCHVRAIHSFPADTKLIEVNAEENLVYLCPTHHWEQENSRGYFAGVVKFANTADCHSADTGSNPVARISAKTKACGCGRMIYPVSKSCVNCMKRQERIKWPDIEILLQAKRSRQVYRLAATLGVSDNAIHKRVKKFMNNHRAEYDTLSSPEI